MSGTACCKKGMKLIVILLLVGIGAFGYYHFSKANAEEAETVQSIKVDGTYLTKASPVAAFNLTDNHGKSFTEESLKGKWTMMFFGFTNCGYVCPTTLAELNKMYVDLQKTLPANKLPQIVFVSVDPERDTVKKMDEYIKMYNKNFIGVRADTDETVKLEKQLHITAVKIHAQGEPEDQYFVNHSAEILLINPNGEIQAYLAYPHKAEQMVKDYNSVLANSV